MDVLCVVGGYINTHVDGYLVPFDIIDLQLRALGCIDFFDYGSLKNVHIAGPCVIIRGHKVIRFGRIVIHSGQIDAVNELV